MFGIGLAIPYGKGTSPKKGEYMRRLNLILILAVAALAVGCGKDKGGSNGSTVPYSGYNPYVPPGSGPGGNPGVDWTYGATAPLVVTADSMKFYTGWTTNNATDVKVNINLKKFAAVSSNGPSYGGIVSISFKDGGKTYEDTFSSLVNESSAYGPGLVTSNSQNNRYNVWITKNGQTAWHGFFQDRYGSIVVVIDDNDDQNDGNGPTVASGSIWVMNFGSSYAPLAPTSCWFISAGPYDCRTWKSGDGVNTNAAIYPYLENSNPGTSMAPKSVGYKKLGDFTNLEFKKAFNN